MKLLFWSILFLITLLLVFFFSYIPQIGVTIKNEDGIANRPCRSAFQKVSIGMTKNEVCNTVGGPPGDYTSRNKQQYVVPIRLGTSTSDHASWIADDGELLVAFDDRDVAVQVGISDVEVRKGAR